MKSNKSNLSPTNILLIDNFGLSHYTSYLARGISKYRRVIVYGLSKSDFIVTSRGEADNIEYQSLEEKLPQSTSIPAIFIKSLFLFFILLIGLSKKKYDIVHVQGYLPMFFLLIPMLKLKRKKIFLTIHDVDLMPSSTGIRGKLDRVYTMLIIHPYLLSKYSNAVIVHAQSLKQKLITKKIDRNKIYVIPHFDYNYLLKTSSIRRQGSVNASYHYQFQKALPQDYALFFGYVVPWKGVDVLMEAVKLVSNQLGEKFNLVVAGTHYYGYESYFNKLFMEDDNNNNVHLINRYIHSFEIPEIIKSSSFLILPYTKDFQHSVSGVIPLAYTFSKPVIVSDLEPLAEYVENGKTGLTFQPGNSVQLANCIIELTKNKDLCKNMGFNANQKLTKEMSLEICSKKINALYDNIKNPSY